MAREVLGRRIGQAVVAVIDRTDRERAVRVGGLHQGVSRHRILEVVIEAEDRDVQIRRRAGIVIYFDPVGRPVGVVGESRPFLRILEAGLGPGAARHENVVLVVDVEVEVRERVAVLIPVQEYIGGRVGSGEVHALVRTGEVVEPVSVRIVPAAPPVPQGVVSGRDGPEYAVQITRVVYYLCYGARVVVIARVDPAHGVVRHLDPVVPHVVGRVL